ncbi:hypothetical protein GCK72_025173 [Caenorhabditis remanei]|uniref:Uncharacterized protein n=1 Tax=Caenorhabditis remanei TaxID=31234 RepID=A0A6A5G181_CAERE|nr:hypothetical protein GCK72_025173 [Caenorhabditis remanei]KAF1748706.1 hypothetical protein GCK72_025173 [Caenorhabditis remanei]
MEVYKYWKLLFVVSPEEDEVPAWDEAASRAATESAAISSDGSIIGEHPRSTMTGPEGAGGGAGPATSTINI